MPVTSYVGARDGDKVGANDGSVQVEIHDGYSFGHHDPNVTPPVTVAWLPTPDESAQHWEAVRAACLNSRCSSRLLAPRPCSYA